MAKCFEESHRAYEAHDGTQAKELSNKGHAHQREMNNLNAQASDWIFKGNVTPRMFYLSNLSWQFSANNTVCFFMELELYCISLLVTRTAARERSICER